VVERFLRLKTRAVSSIRKRGITETVRLVPGFIAATIRGDPDKRFDRRFHVDTAGIIKPIELQSLPRFKDSNWYAPVTATLFREMLSQIKVDFRKFTFIDFGCGKGKALLLASRLPFKTIVGIELWSELYDAAKKNLSSYSGKRKCKNFQLHYMDAKEFRIPDEPSIFFFFDPFREEVMRKVLYNIQASLVAAPRDIYVIYCEPERPDILDQSEFLTLLVRTPHYSIYRGIV
jgi:hypothetical protein